MNRSENAIAVYKSLYMDTKENTPEEVHERVASCIAANDEQKTIFLDMLNNNVFRPNSPCLINARPKPKASKVQNHDNNLVACFVLPLEDTMNSIMDMWTTCAKVYAGGGGTGFPASNLREKMSPISVGGVASGPIEYMKVIQRISDTVKSGGKARRAANLASFWYRHPDIMEFIDCKGSYDFSAINISILVDDEFMNHVVNKDWDVKIDLISPNRNHAEPVGKVTVGDLWNKIVNQAHKTGDPGLLFKTTANKFNPIPSEGEMICANPCGEVVLPSESCCDLGSLNLNKFMIHHNNGEKAQFNYKKYKKYVGYAVDFLNQIIDNTSYPTDGFRDTMLRTRPIGIGIMGLSDIFYKMRMAYGGPESIKMFSEICMATTQYAFERSIDLAEEKESIKFSAKDKKNFRKLLQRYGLKKEYLEKFDTVGIYNSNVTSIAPTGSISISSECSYAFEPMMALVWEKPLVDRNTTLKFTNHEFIRACEEEHNIEMNDDRINEIIRNKGSIQSLNYPQELKDVFVTAHDVGWKKKIEMQEAGQKFITLAISSTCNLPNEASASDVEEAYILAWESGLKGITVYRDGSLSEQPVNFGEVSKTIEPMKVPAKRSGSTIKVKTPHGTMYITVNKNKDKVVEIFLSMGKTGQLESLLMKTLSRTVSKALQYHVPLEALLAQFEEEGGHTFWFKLDEDKGVTVSAKSLVDALSKIIRYHFNDDEVEGYKLNVQERNFDYSKYEVCPSCNKRTLEKSTGCKGGLCINDKCNYTACG